MRLADNVASFQVGIANQIGALTDEKLGALTRILSPLLPHATRDVDGELTFASSDGSSFVMISTGVISCALEKAGELERSTASVLQLLALTIETLGIRPPYPYSISFTFTYGQAGFDAAEFLRGESRIYERILPNSPPPRGLGYRVVFDIPPQVFDIRLEPLFVDLARLYITAQVNSFGAPVNTIDQIYKDVEEKADLFMGGMLKRFVEAHNVPRLAK